MGRWITAQQGDTFCGFAVMGGFVDCQPVRNHAANAAIKDRQLQAGDEVYVPDITERHDSAATERLHEFVRIGAPFASIRFVHGGPDNAIPAEPTLTHLQISNYRTDRAGINANHSFAGANHWQFHAHSDADPDAFKIEVSDRLATNAQIDVELEALHPIYVGGVVTGHDLNWSSAAERNRRRLAIRAHRATPQPDQRYRSAYLRLVVDETDVTARPQQALLITDDQPNEEQVEILDQKVRATYIIQTCPIAGDARCRVTAEVPVGNDRKRIKLCVGILRQNAGDATGFGGVVEAHVRHRLFKWVRRVYAQASMAPKLVDPQIRLLDPPDRNMLTVSDVSGERAAGRTAGGASPSVMSFTVTTNRSDGTSVNRDVRLEIPRPANPGAQLRPIEVANLLVAAINDANFEAEAFENPASIGIAVTRRSADVLIRDRNGGKVSISTVRNSDRSANLRLANVRLNNYELSTTDFDTLYGVRHERQLLRNYNTGSDRMDCYVIGQFSSWSIRGLSYLPYMNAPADFRAPAEIRNSCAMAARSSSGAVMDASNNLPYTFPHELGHALIDCFHTGTRSELMASGGTSKSASVRGTKRICDVPVRIVYQNLIEGTTNFNGTYYYNATTRLRGQISPELFEDW